MDFVGRSDRYMPLGVGGLSHCTCMLHLAHFKSTEALYLNHAFQKKNKTERTLETKIAKLTVNDSRYEKPFSSDRKCWHLCTPQGLITCFYSRLYNLQRQLLYTRP